MPVQHGLYYYDYPAGLSVTDKTSPTVVLLHGAAGSHLSWPPELRRMPGCRILAVDLPGHGKSDSAGGLQTIGQYVEALRVWMESMGLIRTYLVGHSMGGAIALDMALRFPEFVAGLGLVSTGARLRVHPDMLANASNPATFFKAVEQLVLASFGPLAAPRLVELSAKRMAAVRSSVLYGDLLACDGFNCIEALPEIQQPAVVICGSEDQMTPLRYSQFMADRMPNARLVAAPGAGHMVMLEQPHLVGEALAQFIHA